MADTITSIEAPNLDTKKRKAIEDSYTLRHICIRGGTYDAWTSDSATNAKTVLKTGELCYASEYPDNSSSSTSTKRTLLFIGPKTDQVSASSFIDDSDAHTFFSGRGAGIMRATEDANHSLKYALGAIRLTGVRSDGLSIDSDGYLTLWKDATTGKTSLLVDDLVVNSSATIKGTLSYAETSTSNEIILRDGVTTSLKDSGGYAGIIVKNISDTIVNTELRVDGNGIWGVYSELNAESGSSSQSFSPLNIWTPINLAFPYHTVKVADGTTTNTTSYYKYNPSEIATDGIIPTNSSDSSDASSEFILPDIYASTITVHNTNDADNTNDDHFNCIDGNITIEYPYITNTDQDYWNSKLGAMQYEFSVNSTDITNVKLDKSSGSFSTNLIVNSNDWDSTNKTIKSKVQTITYPSRSITLTEGTINISGSTAYDSYNYNLTPVITTAEKVDDTASLTDSNIIITSTYDSENQLLKYSFAHKTHTPKIDSTVQPVVLNNSNQSFNFNIYGFDSSGHRIEQTSVPFDFSTLFAHTKCSEVTEKPTATADSPLIIYYQSQFYINVCGTDGSYSYKPI
jgi:hypothetical protein